MSNVDNGILSQLSARWNFCEEIAKKTNKFTITLFLCGGSISSLEAKYKNAMDSKTAVHGKSLPDSKAADKSQIKKPPSIISNNEPPKETPSPAPESPKTDEKTQGNLSWIITFSNEQTDPGVQERTENLFYLLRYSKENTDQIKMKALINEGVDLKAQGRFNTTLLLEAIKHDHKEIAQLLIEKSDVNTMNMADTDDNTPLHEAAKLGNQEVMELLIEKGADLNVKDSDGKYPLHYAIECFANSGTDENSKKVEMLIDKVQEAGKNWKKQSKEEENPFDEQLNELEESCETFKDRIEQAINEIREDQ
jgi:ankyrin repeat protein